MNHSLILVDTIGLRLLPRMTKYFDTTNTGGKSSRALDGGKVPNKALGIMICAEAQGTKSKKAPKV